VLALASEGARSSLDFQLTLLIDTSHYQRRAETSLFRFMSLCPRGLSRACTRSRNKSPRARALERAGITARSTRPLGLFPPEGERGRLKGRDTRRGSGTNRTSRTATMADPICRDAGRRRRRSRTTITYAAMLLIAYATLTISHCCYVFPKGIAA